METPKFEDRTYVKKQKNVAIDIEKSNVKDKETKLAEAKKALEEIERSNRGLSFLEMDFGGRTIAQNNVLTAQSNLTNAEREKSRAEFDLDIFNYNKDFIVKVIGNTRDIWENSIASSRLQKANEMTKIGQVKEPPNKVLPEDRGHIFDGLLGTKDRATGTTPEITGTTPQVTGTAENILPQNIMNVKSTQNLVNFKQNMSNLFSKNIINMVEKKRTATNDVFANENRSPHLNYDFENNIVFTI
jgi:hypothetical protein